MHFTIVFILKYETNESAIFIKHYRFTKMLSTGHLKSVTGRDKQNCNQLDLLWGRQTLLVKGQKVYVLGFSVLIISSQALNWPQWQEKPPQTEINEWAGLCSNRTFNTDIERWISCHFHESWTTPFTLQPFKKVNGHREVILQDEKVLEAGCPTMQMYSTLLNSTLKS